MLIARSLPDLRAACVRLRSTVDALALVATMGALHAGHLTLVRTAIASGAAAVASIFVNPLQFGPNEDFSHYPAEETGDSGTLRISRLRSGMAAGCCNDVSFWRGDDRGRRWPGGTMGGRCRPGHFRGVATVCAKLFGQVRPDRTYFGEKDWQQLQVVKRMVSDLLLPLEIVGVETVREADGLAMSSRNRFLTPAERAVAPRLYATL